MMTTFKLTDKERSLVLPITLSSQFEWFEFFLFIYWSRIFEREAYFSGLSAPLSEFIYAILLLCSGLFSRPIGGMIFGLIGDKWGRKTAFVYSILFITVPSMILTVSPSFPTWAYSSLVYLGIMRLLQGIPVGGELPGALCLLFEGSTQTRRRYLCSYLFVGTQLGQISSLILITFFTNYLTHEQLLSWGWRLSFGISSIIGITGVILRKKMFKKLHESEEFESLKTEQKIENHPLKTSFKNYKKRMTLFLFLSILKVSGFYLIYYYLFENPHFLKLNKIQSDITYLIYLILFTMLIPVIGYYTKNEKTDKLFKSSAAGVMITSILLFLSIEQGWDKFWNLSIITIIMLFFCVQFSIFPSFLAESFPAKVRFTCIAFSFNVADGFIGGIIPLLSDWLIEKTNKNGIFIAIIPISALIFLYCLKKIIKERKTLNST